MLTCPCPLLSFYISCPTVISNEDAYLPTHPCLQTIHPPINPRFLPPVFFTSDKCIQNVIYLRNTRKWVWNKRRLKIENLINLCEWAPSLDPGKHMPGKARREIKARRKERGSTALWFEVKWSVSCEQAVGKGGEWWWCMGTVWCCEWAVRHAVSREIPALLPSDGINWWWMERMGGNAGMMEKVLVVTLWMWIKLCDSRGVPYNNVHDNTGIILIW